MPDDRRAWHRGGACLLIVNLLRRGRTTGHVRTCGAIRFAIAPYVLGARGPPRTAPPHQRRYPATETRPGDEMPRLAALAADSNITIGKVGNMSSG